MRNLRVLVLSQMYPKSASPNSGIFIHNQVRHLIKAGCDVTVISPVPYLPSFIDIGQRRRLYRHVPECDEIDGVPVLYPRYFRPPSWIFHAPSVFTMYGSLCFKIRKIINRCKPQIIHAHTATPAGYSGVMIGRKFGLPTVVSLRGGDINVFPYRDPWTLGLTRTVLHRADKVCAVSQALKTAALKVNNRTKPVDIEVVYNGCDLQMFSFDAGVRDNFRDELNVPSDGIVLLFSGNVVQEKGICELLEAFIDLSQSNALLHLIVVGSGKLSNSLAARVGDAGLQERVHLVGFRPHQEIPGWMSACDVLILPSWREGLPNVVLEAMACSRPVIATNVGGIPECVEHGKSGYLIEKKDIRALKWAIKNLSSDSSKRIRMGFLGRSKVVESFNWQRNADETIRIYQEVLRA